MLYKLLSLKVTFLVTSKLTPPTLFNLQALEWIHCEEETDALTGISRLTSKLLHLKKKIKVVQVFWNVALKKYVHFKKFH